MNPKNQKKMAEQEKPVLEIIGHDGNAFAILGKAMKVAKKHGLDWDKIKSEAIAGDYDHLLGVMMKYFEVE
jgi:hypothetical protein